MSKAQALVTEQSVYFFGDSGVDGDPDRKDVLGGKGASLAAMTKAGLPVPPGFTIPIQCCREYHENGGAWPEGLEEKVRANLERLEKSTGKTFGTGASPLLVSVRSGAAKSMPGMMDTILNCGLHPELADVVSDKKQFWSVYAKFAEQFGTTVAGIQKAAYESLEHELSDSDGSGEKLAEAFIFLYEDHTGKKFPGTPWECLCECINAVFDSWNNERALIYRKAHGLEGLEGTAVNVQSMFNSVVSGIGFTANPSNPSASEIIIESSYGLGESIVSGNVTPDRFVLDRETQDIKDRTIGDKAEAMYGLGVDVGDELPDPHAPSLTDEQVKEVAGIALNVEKYFGFPVDIEWGLEKGRFSLLQSRAIRGLDVIKDVEVGRQEEIARLRKIAGDREKVWVAHNLSETLPCPTPMTWDIIKHFMSAKGGYGQMYLDFGYRPSKVVYEDGFLELICGQIYVDPERAASSFWDGFPLKYDHQEIVDDPHIIESAPGKFDAEHSDANFLLKLPGTVVAMIRSSRKVKRLRATALERFTKEILPPYLTYIEHEHRRDLAAMSAAELVNELESRIQKILTEFGNESLKPGFFGGCSRAELEQLLVQVLGSPTGENLCNTLTSGLADDSTVEQNTMLFEVAHNQAKLEDFIASYGHRAVGEMELKNPRWRDDPSYLDKVISNYPVGEATSPAHMHEKNEARCKEAMETLMPLLKEWGGAFLYEEIVAAAQEAQSLLAYRETGKHYLMMGYELIRAVLVELGRRLEIQEDIFFLRRDELPGFESNREELLKAIEKRKIRWQSAQRLDMADVISTENLDKLGLPREIKTAAEYDATVLSGGVVEGSAHIVFDPAEAGELEDDCILICPSTDPSWTALFTSIKGLIVERGGVLSHGAITARDFSIPAVSCPDATRLIEEGAKIRVNGDLGHISIIKE